MGFGSLGRQICKEILKDDRFEIIQIVDTDPILNGLKLGKFFKTNSNLIIQNRPTKTARPDVIIHSTVSRISDAFEQFTELVLYKAPILSTCEELVYPINSGKKFARKIDLLALKNKISILGIGVNPGYLMDSLVLSLTNLFLGVKFIDISRTVNLSKRRKSLQEKMLVGKNKQKFEKYKTKLGHVGLKESATMICEHFGIKPNIERELRPITAKKNVRNRFFDVKKGNIIGIQENLSVFYKKKAFLKMKLDMYLGAKEIDSIFIRGSHSVKFQTDGVNGDKATIALLVNHIETVLRQDSGLFVVDGSAIKRFKA